MKIFLIILAVIILIAAAILFLPIPLSVRIVNSDISLKLFNLPFVKRLKKEKQDDKPKLKDKKDISFDDVKQRIAAGRKLYTETKPQLKLLLNRLFKVAKVIYYRTVVTMGFDDPMNTGMAIGVAGTFFTELNSFFNGILAPRRQSYLSAVPNFNESGLNFVAEVKLHISVFNALLFLKELLDYKKNNEDAINIILGGNKK